MKDKSLQKTRKRVERYRNKKSSVTQDNNVTQSLDSVTSSPESVTLDVTQYPAILKALVDPDKRIKLEKICHSLTEFKQETNVYYGASKSSIDIGIVGELLEATSQ